MALIDLIVHEYDRLSYWRWGRRPKYGVQTLLEELARRGHSWRTVTPEHTGGLGDVAILHVDCTFVPDEYLEHAARYPLCLNIGSADISKRHVSMALLEDHPGWTGPVIIKTDLNARGIMERAHNRRARRIGRPPPHPDPPPFGDYRVFPAPDAVPEALRNHPDLVCEIFEPEHRGELAGSRSWLFCGDHGRALIRLGPKGVLRHRNLTVSDYTDLPDLAAQRRALGFDFGKFDYIMHDGKPLLIDAAKTVGWADTRHGVFAREPERFGDALERALGLA